MYIAFGISILGCASSGSLGGGPKDTQPPKVVIEGSTPQRLINFKQKEIKLIFDEYIQLKNPSKEIHVSPPLTYRLQTKLRGKELSLMFNEKEILKEDVTYIINMGSSIADFREGNILENYRYVFSTGDVIDSLSIEGKVLNFVTREPIDGATVMLYNKLQDSTVINEKPYYLIKTNKEGDFILENIKQDTFRLYVITDANNNYIYNPSSEGIGFVKEDIYLTSNMKDVNISVSDPNPPLRLLRTINSNKGRLDFLFSEELSLKPEYKLDSTITIWEKINKDTLTLFYDTDIDSFQVLFPGIDTIKCYSQSLVPSENLHLSIPENVNQLRINDSLEYRGSAPIIQIQNEDSIEVFSLETIADSLEIDSLEVDSLNAINVQQIKTRLICQSMLFPADGTVILKANFDPGKYSVIIPPKTFKDIYGRWNDTLKHSINCLYEDELSSLNIIIDQLDTNQVYIVNIKTKSKPTQRFEFQYMDSVSILTDRIIPESYEVEIIEDVNRNGIWDPPSIWGRIPAEPILKKSFDPPKASWEVEEIIIWSKGQL